MSEEQPSSQEVPDLAPQQPVADEVTPQELEKQEEAKLKAKFPTMPGGRFGGHSAFLQKRLAKGQKFFDSGDYQMAKQKTGGVNKPPLRVPGQMFQTGEAIPTPETVPVRKTSLAQPSKLASVTVSMPAVNNPFKHPSGNN